ncbi:MAG: hypothetical protein HYV07_32200 [Deltaproteobacteria bacterium]|nr:hypothetical protein [Deltaproteobacteria bacterium]
MLLLLAVLAAPGWSAEGAMAETASAAIQAARAGLPASLGLIEELRFWGETFGRSHEVGPTLDRILALPGAPPFTLPNGAPAPMVTSLPLRDTRASAPRTPSKKALGPSSPSPPNARQPLTLAASILAAIPRERIRARSELAALRELAPASSLADLVEARVARAFGDEISSLRLLESAMERDPSLLSALAEWSEILEASAAGVDLALARLEAHRERDLSPLLLERLAALSLRKGDLTSAKLWSEAALSLDSRRTAARSTLLTAAERSFDGAAYSRAIEGRVANEPWALEAQLSLARRRSAEDREGALDAAVELTQRFPLSPEAAFLLAETLWRSGRDADAARSYARALALDPNSRPALEALERLEGSPPKLEQPDLGELRATPEVPGESEAGGAILFDHSLLEVLPTHRARITRTLVARLHGSSAPPISFELSPSRETFELISARKSKRDGTEVPIGDLRESGSPPSTRATPPGLTPVLSTKTISAGSTEPGELVIVDLRRMISYPPELGPTFASTHDLSENLPKHLVTFDLISDRAITPLAIGGARIEGEVVDEHGRRGLRYRARDVPARSKLRFAPPPTETHPMVGASAYSSWARVGESFSILIEGKLELDDATKAITHEAARTAKTERELVTTLLERVSSVEYTDIELGRRAFEPKPAMETLRSGLGDCKDLSTLLVALLREAGLSANVALIRTRPLGSIPETFPTPFAFDHAVVYVEAPAELLDPSVSSAGPGELPADVVGAQILIVRPSGRSVFSKVAEALPETNSSTSKYRVKVASDGSARLDGIEETRGARAPFLREIVRDEAAGASRLAAMLDAELDGISLEALTPINRGLDEPVRYRFVATVPKLAARRERKLSIPLTLYTFALEQSFGPEASRREDLVFEGPWVAENDVTYELPAGHSARELPEPIVLETKWVALEQLIEPQRTGYRVRERIRFLASRVAVRDFSEFATALRTIDEALERHVEVER